MSASREDETVPGPTGGPKREPDRPREGGTIPAQPLPTPTAAAPHATAAAGRGNEGAGRGNEGAGRGDAGRGNEGAGRGDEGIGSVLGGRFEIVQELGRGGMGVVYLANDRQVQTKGTPRQVALKVVHPELSADETFRERVGLEISAATQFVSEYVNQVRDSGRLPDGRLFMTMDLVDGRALDDLLQAEGTLAVRHALEIARQTLLGLQSGHARGFVHRDVKPSNVMLERRVPKTDENPYGVGVKLLDFGIAGAAVDLEVGQLIGTPYYMSPEQVRGHPLDARSDLFATGVMLYEMLAGGPPFTGKTLHDITTAVLETDVQPLLAELEHIAGPVREIVRKALEKDRDKRFQSAQEFVAAIERSSAYRPKVKAPGWLVGTVAAVVVLGAGASGYLLWQVQAINAERDRQAALAEARAAEVDRLNGEVGLLQYADRTKGEKIEELKDELAAKVEASQLENLQLAHTELDRDYGNLKEALGKAEAERDAALAHSAGLEQELAVYRDPLRNLALKLASALKLIGSEDFAEAHALLVEFEQFPGLSDSLAAGSLVDVVALRDLTAAMVDFERIVGGSTVPAAELTAVLGRIERAAAVAAERDEGFDARGAWMDRSPIEPGPIGLSPASLDRGPGPLAAFAAAAQQRVASFLGERDRERERLAEVAARGVHDGFLGDLGLLRTHVARFGVHSSVAEHVDALAADLEAHVHSPSAPGALDPAAVAGLRDLDDWVGWLEGLEEPSVRPALRRIADVAAARHFFATAALDGLGAFAVGPLDEAPRYDWRSELALKRLLLERRTGPLGGRTEAVYVSPETDALFKWTASADGDGAVRTFDLDQRKDLGTLQFAWDGPRLTCGGRLLADLLDHGDGARTGRSVKVARWVPPAIDVDARLSAAQRESRRRTVERGAIDCLVVVDDDGGETWISPRYGIVRMRDLGAPTELLAN